jgi:predicted ester cyclase
MARLIIPIFAILLAAFLVAGSALVPGRLGSAAAHQASPAASPTADCPTTTEEENKALVESYWNDVYNGRDPQRVVDYLTEDFVRNNPERPQPNEPGLEDDIALVTENIKDYSDLTITIDYMVAEGDLVSALLTRDGTQTDSVTPWNAPAANKSSTIWIMLLYRVECGKLAEQWAVADYLSMLRQTGIITDDELATLGSAANPAATPEP